MKYLLLFLCFSSCAFGQSKPEVMPHKIKVHLNCTCEDVVGSKYATALRDLIATSPRYIAADNFVDGTGTTAVWNYGLRIVTLDPSNGKTGVSTVIAVTITWGPIFLDSLVQTCGDEVAKSCASSTFASLDKDVSN